MTDSVTTWSFGPLPAEGTITMACSGLAEGVFEIDFGLNDSGQFLNCSSWDWVDPLPSTFSVTLDLGLERENASEVSNAPETLPRCVVNGNSYPDSTAYGMWAWWSIDTGHPDEEPPAPPPEETTTTTTEAPPEETTTTTTEAPPEETTTTLQRVCIANGDTSCADPARMVLFDLNATAALLLVVGLVVGVLFASHTLRDPGRLDR